VRDGVALAVLVVVALGTAAGLGYVTTDLPPGAAPDASFEATGLENGTVTVEHAGGEPVEGLRVLVYEDRRFLPDRTVHATAWGVESPVRPGEEIELEDPRFESDQRLVVRWFGNDGQANLSEQHI
jgi:hypothetical protein